MKSLQLIVDKHTKCLRNGFHEWPLLGIEGFPALGDARWSADLILSTWYQAENGHPPTHGLEYRKENREGDLTCSPSAICQKSCGPRTQLFPYPSIEERRENRLKSHSPFMAQACLMDRLVSR